MNDPLAYFLTWTTYGTWLHGDKRGWVHRNESGVQSENSKLNQYVESNLSDTPLKLTHQDRQIIEDVMREHADIKDWNILALNVRSNHVHLVIEAPVSPSEVMRQLKMWATRKEVNPDRKKWWTKQGDRKLLFTEEAVENAVRYTLEGQEKSEYD